MEHSELVITQQCTISDSPIQDLMRNGTIQFSFAYSEDFETWLDIFMCDFGQDQSSAVVKN